MSVKSNDDAALDIAGEGGASADPFDALLREAARVSGAVAARGGPPLAVGAALAGGRLSILSKLGEGGMGVVYEAFDAQRKGRVACKTLSRLEASSVYRLKNEFRALADVTHPNLVRLHELFAEGEAWFFTMELVVGERFDRWVRPGQGVLDEPRLRAALPQLLAAMNAIHAAGKLHRDLKPSNVLVTAEGRVVVLDFGLAIDPEFGGVGQTIAEDSVSGTPGYMAPEQAAGLSATTASDFYALGAMLFEALTGKLPFEGRIGEIIAAKQTRDAPRAGALVAGLPADLEALCAELLARDAAARPDATNVAARLGVQDARGTDPARGRSTPSRGRAASESDPAPSELLGREPELQALREAFAATQRGKPVVLFVTGESGMGKSALCEAFAGELRAHGRATVLAGRCYERENVPFKGFDALVDDLSRHLRRLPSEEAAAVLPREAYALARIFPVLARIAVVAAAPKKDVSEPQELKRRAFEAFAELLARMRDRGPLVLLLDDVQWLDQDSVRFMRALLLHAEPVPLLLVCAHRSEGAGDNALLQSVRQAARDNPRLDRRELQVGPLPAAALNALAQRLLPAAAQVQLAAVLAAEAQGSPFFAGELARAVAVRGLEHPPPSLAEALSLHVSGLPEGARRTLSLLAVCGQPLAVEVVIAAANDPDGHGCLDRLRAEQLVRVSIGEGGLRAVECYHDKIREQIAAALDEPAVQALALALARALAPRADADAELQARLLELAGLPAEAAAYAARAAELARSKLAFDRAARLFAQALEHGQFGPERTQALRVARADALAQAGRPSAAAEALLAAAQHASASDAHELERQAGVQYLLGGDLEHGRALLDRALRRVGSRLPLSLTGAIAGVTWSRARLRLRGLKFTPKTQHDAATLRELEVMREGVIALVRSDFLRGADLCARYTMRALDAGHAEEIARALGWEILVQGLLNTPRPQVDAAIALCEELCDRTGDHTARLYLLYWRAFHKGMMLGQQAPALADLKRFLELLTADPTPTAAYDRSWESYHRSGYLMLLGRLGEVADLACPQCEDAFARGDHTAACALVQMACFGLVAAGRVDQADRLIGEVEALLRPGEVTGYDMYWFGCRVVSGVYRRRAREVWYETAEHRARYFGSWQARIMASPMRLMAAGLAAEAARTATDASERQTLTRQARDLAKRATGSAGAGVDIVPRDTLLACLDRDRDRAVAALRRAIPHPGGPLLTALYRRRLGELLGDAEGAELIAQADAFLRAGGVVDPARFTAAFVPGIAL